MLDANTGLRCKEMLFLEFSDIDWNAGVLHVRNKTQAGFRPKGRKERRIPLNVPAMYALQSMLQKKACEERLRFSPGRSWALIERPYSGEVRAVGALYDRPAFRLFSPIEEEIFPS